MVLRRRAFHDRAPPGADLTGSHEHPAVRADPYNAGLTGPDGGSTVAAIADATRSESEQPTLASELATAEEGPSEIQAIMDNALHPWTWTTG